MKSPTRQINPARRIRQRYIFGLSLIALVAIIGQIFIQRMISDESGIATVINLSGRQRMLSKQLVISVLQGDEHELRDSLETWTRAHNALDHGDRNLGLMGETPEAVSALLDRLKPEFDAIAGAANAILTGPTDEIDTHIETILAHEKVYLATMEQVVLAYAEIGESRIRMLAQVEYALIAVILIILLVEVLLIFEPLIRELSTSWSKLSEKEDQFRLAVDGSSDVIWDWNLETDTIYLAPRFAELVGADPDSIGDSSDELFARITPDHFFEFNEDIARVIHDPLLSLDTEIQIRHEDGSDLWVLCRAAELRDAKGHATRLVGSLADITELKESQSRLQVLAERDQLTGLANRDKFIQELEARIDGSRNEDQHFAVMFLDFDRFKLINDSLGHSVGDGLLISIARRLENETRDDAVVARFGGDEFALLVSGIDAPSIRRLGQRLVKILAQPHQVGHHEIVSTASIGMVLCNPRYDSADSMLRDADIAMYEAKAAGKARLVSFDTEMHDEVVAQQQLEKELLLPGVTDQMHLVYQPIIDLSTGETKGFEALVRWTLPDGKMVTPDRFIAVAEECGAIVRVGSWIFRQASEQLAAWDQELGHERLTVNVNISRKQLLSPDFLEEAELHAELHPKRAGRLILEITETAVIDERVDVVPILEKLRGFGYRLAMDDFGTGYSSLSCLHRFPIDILKVDRSFVVNIEQRREFTAVIAAIVTLALALELEVVAEGIDSPSQLAQLQAMDCSYGQGYLFAKPMLPDDALQYLNKGSGGTGLHHSVAA